MMHRKLTDKEKKIVLAVLFVIIAAFLVYVAIQSFRSKSEENPETNAATVSLEVLETNVPTERESADETVSNSAGETEVASETEETILPWDSTLPPQTDPPGFWEDLTRTEEEEPEIIVPWESLPEQTDPPGFWEDLTATETEPPVIITPTTAPTSAPTVAPTQPTQSGNTVTLNGVTVTKGEVYNDKDHVALYIHAFKSLPPNYITKNQADNMNNWQSKGYYIGGDKFGNREGRLPKKSGRQYYECDISYSSTKNRGTKRIVYSNDGLIYYTDDHYETFTKLY